MNKFILMAGLVISSLSSLLMAEEEVEEVVVTGSQIKGAKITGVLPVSVLSADDIEAIGPEDGLSLIHT